MPRTYSQQYQRKREYLTKHANDTDSAVTTAEKEAIFEFCDAFDEDRPTVSKPPWPNVPGHLTSYRSQSTLANWMYHLTEYAKNVDILETTERELNRIAEQWLNGTNEHKAQSISKGTIRAYQNSARMFYRYHDVGVDHEQIAVFEANDNSINPRDMLTPEEIAKARETPDHARDQCILDMLLYTGLRNNGLRTLRIKDIDTDAKEWYFNDEEDHLKDIHQPQAPRPLLGAVAAVREWLSYHPYGDDPDAYLIVGKPKWQTVDPHEPVSDRTIERVMDGIKEDAEIEKPMHPHMMRHNFVTLCKREYDLDNETVKFLIGHGPDSDVMQTTYAHLSGDDHKQKAEVAAGLREEDEQSSLTPDHCLVCDEPLPPYAKSCPRCATAYTPDGRSTQEQINDSMFESANEAETEQEQMDVAEYREFVRENPNLAQEIQEDVND